MTRSAIICPDSDVRSQMATQLVQLTGVYLVRQFEIYPSEHDLALFLRASAVDVIFISPESIDKVIEVSRIVEQQSPATQMVAIDRGCDIEMVRRLMQAGVRDFLTVPLETQIVLRTLDRVTESASRQATPTSGGDLFCFLPAKPGAGASTIALNTAVALSRESNSKVLLVDFDLNLGAIGFLLGLGQRGTIHEAAAGANAIDERVWPKYVAAVDKLDVITSGKLNPANFVEAIQARQLLEYARRMYTTVCADLSGNMEQFSIEVMLASTAIYLVCSPETSSMHQARQKLSFLRKLDLLDRVRLLVNRTHKRDSLTLEELEKHLELAPKVVFPYDYDRLQEAALAGTPAQSGSRFAESCANLATALSDGGTQRKRGVLGLFSPSGKR